MAENGGFTEALKRGNYRLRERMLIKHRIYQLILDGYNDQRIRSELGLSERTLLRYKRIIFSEEMSIFDETAYLEEMKKQFVLARDRFLEDRLEIKEWLRANPQADDRVELANLRAELSAAVLRLYRNGLTRFVRSDDINYNTNALREEEEEREKYRPPFLPYRIDTTTTNNKENESNSEKEE